MNKARPARNVRTAFSIAIASVTFLASSLAHAADGTIHGKGYKGEWTTKDGEMCFAYGEGPTCYGVSIDGPSMVLRQDGVIKGNGMLVKGNTVK